MNVNRIVQMALALAALGAGGGHAAAQDASRAGAAQQVVPAEAPAAPGAEGARGPFRHHGRDHRRGDAMLRWLDADRDGVLSRAEFDGGQRRMVAMFERADADHDGRLTSTEMRTMHEAVHAEMRAARTAGGGRPRDGAAAPAAPAAPATPR